MRRKTLAIDFDGVLHAYTSEWTSPEDVRDGPVPGAIAFLWAAVDRFDVAVFSVRAEHEVGVAAIATWLAKHGAPIERIRITSEKPKAVVYLDDRGWRFDGVFPSLDAIEAFKPWNRR